MTKKFWNWIRDETTGERILRLDGAISDETWLGDKVTPIHFRQELNSGEGDIVIWVNSPGGDVFAAVEIYNMLKEYRGKVTIKIDALCASAASIVAMAADTIEISPAGQMFLHNPETAAIGNKAEFEAAIDMLNEVKESIINAYELKTHLSRKRISELMDAATWLNARKAIELGFADKVMYSDEQAVQPAKMFSERRITNSIAEAFRATRKEKNDNRVSSNTFRKRLEILKGVKK